MRLFQKVLFSLLCIMIVNATISVLAASENESTIDMVPVFLLESYEVYLDVYEHAPDGQDEIWINTEDIESTKGDVQITTHVGGYAGNVVLSNDQSITTWAFDVNTPGLYSIEVNYYPIRGRGIDIERSVSINGNIPYREAYSVSFKRRWVDRQPVSVNPNGNDINPQQVEAPVWMSTIISDSAGYYTEPLKFHFEQGRNTLSLIALAEPMAIKSIRIFPYEQIDPYQVVLQQYERLGHERIAGVFEKIQAEHTLSKSDAKIRPKTDRSSPLTEPYHPSYLRLNMIGGASWQYPGEYVEWKIDVEQSGLYQIAFRFRQELKTSTASVRKLSINGEVPFAEMQHIEFTHHNEWQLEYLKDEQQNPYLFYLEEGSNVIRMEVTLGRISDILRQVEETIHILNELYRNIIVYTGTVPDPFTDYTLERIIPETMDALGEQGRKLRDISEQMMAYGAIIGGDTAFIETYADQLIQISENPHTINNRLAHFKTNIGSLGAWLNELTISPLKLDYIIVASLDKPLPRANAGFFQRMLHEIRAFIGSFRQDYSVMETGTKEYEEQITVWLGSVAGLQAQTGGRDQALLIKNMIESDFSEKTGIGVNLRLVDAGAMLPAVLAGNAPDVAVSMAGGLPVQYALRNAVVDFSKLDDFEKISQRFPQGAFVPVTYAGSVYGIPENITWDMLFYRKDILHQLDINIPQTWDEMINLIPILAANRMEIGIPPGMYHTFLYQNGLSIYDEQTDRCLFDSREATKIFADFTSLFVNYRLPVAYDMFNRFRTGEMPMVVAPYNSYNTLVIFAPEIRGFWDFALIPGTRRSDGTIDRTAIGTGAYTVLFEQSQNKDKAWSFIKWWTDAPTQLEYGIELEGLLGPAGRYTTANMEALQNLPWQPQSLNMLMEQAQWLSGIPEVPGGYFMTRHYLNAFYAVYNRGSEPRETLMQYTLIINDEIEKKRKEFGLE